MTKNASRFTCAECLAFVDSLSMVLCNTQKMAVVRREWEGMSAMLRRRGMPLFVGLLLVSSIMMTSLYGSRWASPVKGHEDRSEAYSAGEVLEQEEDIVSPEEENQIKDELPHVAWIMSYGGSGTSYTIVNLEEMSTYSTASNYAADYDPLVPVHDGWKEGPYIRSLKKELPPKYIGTKTHCGGYCMDCSPSSYVHTPESFERSCLTGQITVDGEHRAVTYNREIPRKAVHLIRSPFDNLVGRLHLAVKNRLGRGEAPENLANFTNDKDGLVNWCHSLAEKHGASEQNSPLLPEYYWEKYSHIPCHAEWFRYVQWHNLAHEVVSNRLEIPVHYLYYDDYSNDYNGTIDSLFDFLELPHNAPPLEFLTGKNYDEYFDAEYVTAAAKMSEELASEPVWKLLRHFFEDR